MGETSHATEEAFEKYYEAASTCRNSGWVYLGFASLAAMGLLTGMILDWSTGGDVGRLVPGGSASEVFITFLGMEMELKALEYAGIFVALVFALVSYAMASK